MTSEEAEQLVIESQEIEALSMAVIPNSTYESTKCFVVSCQSKEYIETGNEAHFLIGHGPFLVDKETGTVHSTGSARSEESYIASFEKYGDPHKGIDVYSVKIEISPREAVSQVTAIKAIKQVLNVGTKEANNLVRELREGGSVTRSGLDYWNVSDTLDGLGFKVTQLVRTV